MSQACCFYSQFSRLRLDYWRKQNDRLLCEGQRGQGLTQESVLFEVKQSFAQDCPVDLGSELHLDIFEGDTSHSKWKSFLPSGRTNSVHLCVAFISTSITSSWPSFKLFSGNHDHERVWCRGFSASWNRFQDKNCLGLKFRNNLFSSLHLWQ